ncbi:SRR1-like protein [Onychostruthus taczanowskii]|uniref:SRR1-like protein n=1 Tax=Onychostruthus taczanowskii TaxID=356909 RepID=UPI001B80E645|nr:SRR1-like protein [Onychostruthus taczanowskii]
MAAAAGGWRAGRARRRRRRGRGEEEEDDDEEEGEGGPGTEAVLRRLREARDDLLSSGFWAASAGAVRAPLGAEPPARCVCYGLGRFGRCPAARYQLAFLLLLLDELRVPPARCAVFDPAFSAREAAALRALGLCLLPENEEGKHGIQGVATLFYMVHCGKALYNNLLWSNWSPAALSKLVIIGNSFRGIEERLLSRILERDYSYIAKVLKGVEEVALPSHPRYLDTFNDTSVHWFPLDKLQELSPEVWDFVEEPLYQDCEDLEIIRKGEEATAKS